MLKFYKNHEIDENSKHRAERDELGLGNEPRSVEIQVGVTWFEHELTRNGLTRFRSQKRLQQERRDCSCCHDDTLRSIDLLLDADWSRRFFNGRIENTQKTHPRFLKLLTTGPA